MLLNAQKVCTTWRRICKEPSKWRVINPWKNLGDISDKNYDLEEMCRHAIDLSQGQVVDICLEILATDDLLSYVAQRSGKLKRLSIAFYVGKVCKGLDEVVRKLPLLEELSLTHTIFTEYFFELIYGRSCPKFKKCDHFYEATDEEALAIAKNLPALRHLQLLRNKMTNEGLKTILSCCPNLVSLDLRECSNVNLNKDLSNRISRQIKDVKYPDDDSLDGLKFTIRPVDE